MTASSEPRGEHGSLPRCTIIIPTRDQLGYLRSCVEGVLASTDRDKVELIVVDNDSQEMQTREYLQSLATQKNCRVLSWAEAFNVSAINNFAVAESASELVCFLSNEIEISDPDWLHKLVPLAARADVGAVGCLLRYPDGRIQHAGIELDEFAIASHIGQREDASALAGYRPYATAALTAACLLMRRELFQRFGGFNAERLAIAYHDVDLCLRLGEKGLPVLLHPGVNLVHHESDFRQNDSLSRNRDRARREHEYMLFRWQQRLTGERASVSLADYFLRLGDEPEATLDATLAKATAALYREKSTGEHIPAHALDSSPEATSDAYWHNQYQQLERNFQQLRMHVERVEQAHQLIEQSIFWRMTAPLRRLRDLLRRTGPGAAPTQSEANACATIGETTPPSENEIKAAYDRDADAALQRFLASGEGLDFHRGEAAGVSVLLILYNRAPLTLLCLRSLLAQTGPDVELIIVDNASRDETGELLARVEGATVIRNAENVGFVLAVNQGAQEATSDYLLLLNNDAVLAPDAVANAVAVMSADRSIGALGGKIRLLDGNLQEAGSIIFNDGACLGYGRGRPADEPEFMFRRDVDYCSGAFLLLHRQQFLDMGGFDEDYAPAYYEESDYCVRLWQAGYRVVYEPTCQVDHYEFASSGGIKGASVLQSRHREVLCRKHRGYLAKKLDNDPDNILSARIANSCPRVLMIDDRVPHPSLGSGYPRCAHMLSVLDGLAINVTFYPLRFPSDDWQEVYRTVPATTEVMLGLGEAGLQRFLQERRDYFDVIVISRVHNMEFCKRLFDREPELIGRSRIIYDAEAVSAPREAARLRLIGGNVSAAAEEEMIRDELETARHADHVLAVSAGEAELFNRYGYVNTSVLGHVIEARNICPGYSDRHGLLFVGALRDDGSPNVDSLLWFVINVLPLIRQAIPGIHLTVVGDNAAPSLAAIDSEAIEFTGRLESIDSLYDNHRVFVAPTRFAAGIPHKVHEAAGMGIPSVVTALLARQLGWQDGQEVVVGDNVQQFADACLRLYQDESLWQTVQRAGLEAVSRDCSKAVFCLALTEALEVPHREKPG